MLYEMLGFEDAAFPAGLGWHDQVARGLPVRSLSAFAAFLGMPESQLAGLLLLQEQLPTKASARLTPASSERLFRMAVAAHRLYAALKDRDKTRFWLQGARKELGGAMPLEMLAHAHSAHEVYAVIERVRPPKPAVERSTPVGAETSSDEELDD